MSDSIIALLRMRERQNAAIEELGRLASSGASMDALMKQAARLVSKGLDVEFMTVLELLRDDSGLLLRAGTGWADGRVGHTINGIGTNSQAGYTLLSAKPVIVGDLNTETRFTCPPLLYDHAVVSSVTVIISYGTQPYGILGAYTAHRRDFTAADVHFLQSAANLLGMAVERWKLLDSLTGSEGYNRQIIAGAQEGIIVCDREMRYLSGNQFIEKLSGLPAPDALGQRVPDLFPFLRGRGIESLVERAIAGETITSPDVEYIMPGAAGSVWISNQLGPLRDTAGNIVGFLAFVRDVTDQKRAERELVETKERIEQLLSVNPAVIYSRALGGDFGVTFVSNNVRQQLGYEPRDFMENPSFWNDHIHAEDRERVLLELSQLFESGIHTVEYRFIHESQTCRWLHDQWTLVCDESGNPTKIVGSCMDITNRKTAEEKLKVYADRLRMLSSRRMEAQEIEQNRIARKLHDEIGQELTVVKMNLHTLEELTEANPAIQLLSDSAGIMERIIQQIRNLSRDLYPSMLEDLGLVAALHWQVDRHARRAGITADFIADPTMPRPALAIEMSCFRVAQEALTNALKHAKAKRLSIQLRCSDKVLLMIVRDDGAGFDVDEAWKRVSQGESLGLLSMEERVSSVGGHIEVRSSPGGGTEVRVQFPLRERSS